MTVAAINSVVRLVLVSTAAELTSALGCLPHGVRFGIAHELDEVGEAHRYEIARHCAYYLRRQRNGVAIWRWSYIASPLEAGRLRDAISTLARPLDIELANRVFELATRRRVSDPRPRGMALLATDYSAAPALYAGGA